MSTISIRLQEKEDALIRKYAQMHNMDISRFVRSAVLEKIEDEFDLTLFDQVWEQEQNSERLSHDQLKKELGL